MVVVRYIVTEGKQFSPEEKRASIYYTFINSLRIILNVF